MLERVRSSLFIRSLGTPQVALTQRTAHQSASVEIHADSSARTALRLPRRPTRRIACARRPRSSATATAWLPARVPRPGRSHPRRRDGSGAVCARTRGPNGPPAVSLAVVPVRGSASTSRTISKAVSTELNWTSLCAACCTWRNVGKLTFCPPPPPRSVSSLYRWWLRVAPHRVLSLRC